MNTYYFSVIDNTQNTETSIYKIEAANLQEAKQYFCSKFMPLLEGVNYDDLLDWLSDHLDVIVHYLGNKITIL